MEQQTQSSRRRFLQAVAVTGGVASVTATVLAQDQDGGQFENIILLGGKVAGWQGYRFPEKTLIETSRETAETTPEGTAMPVNPTLELESGTTYTLLWKNLDGEPHSFAIQDSDGSTLSVLRSLTVSANQFEAVNMTASETTLEESPTEVETTPTEEVERPSAETTTVQRVAVTQEVSEQGAVQGVQFTASEEMARYVCMVHPHSMSGDLQINGIETTPDGTTPG